jgi:hypothetical protein
MDLFTADAYFVVFMGIGAKEPAQEYRKREDLAPVFDNLNSYEATTHSTDKAPYQFKAKRGRENLIAWPIMFPWPKERET